MATTGHKAISAEELEVATVFVLQCALDAHPWQKCNKLFLHKILKKKTRRIRKGHTVAHGMARRMKGEEGAWLAVKRQLRQLRNAYKNRAPLARLHIYHFKLPAAEALPAVAAGLCGAAHTHPYTHTCTQHNCLDSQTKATHGLSTFQLAPWEPTSGSSSCSSCCSYRGTSCQYT